MNKTPLLTRPQLIRQLIAALHTGHVLLIAPAGYGKTTLLHNFIASQPDSTYLRLSLADSDVERFKSRLPTGLAPQSTCILDDTHNLQPASEVWDWLAEQLERDGPRFVVSGRFLPEGFAQRLGAMSERLTERDLAFTLEESQALLPNVPSVAEWHTRTGGWPLALSLLARQTGSLDHRGDLSRSALFDYLAETLVSQLPPELVGFIERTALPLQFSDSLASALMDAPMEQIVELRAEALRRNLFVEAVGDGWWKYHDLIREFLLARVGVDEQRTGFEQAAGWFEAHGDLPMAIEHALAGSLFESAARRLEQLPTDFIWGQGRHRTFQRWVASLDETACAAHPLLLVRLGRELIDIGRFDQAYRYLDLGLRYAEASPDAGVRFRARLSVAKAHNNTGQPGLAIEICQAILSTPDLDPGSQRQALNTYANALIQFCRFREAQHAYLQALALPEDEFSRPNALIRQNLATAVLIPLGEFEAAERTLREAERDAYMAKQSHGRWWHYLGWASLHESMGDWDALGRDLAELDRAEFAAEVSDEADVWTIWWRALWRIGTGQFEQAEAGLDDMARVASNGAEEQICLAYARVWLRRRQGQAEQVMRLADEALAQAWPVPLYRGLIALERAIVADDLHPALTELLRVRSRPALVRLRAWLAVRSHRRNDARWERHTAIVLRSLERFGYERLLTTRDPELGASFWALCLTEGLASNRAVQALCEIGAIEAIAPLLGHAEAPVRVRVAQALAAMNCEEAMPLLADALSIEQERAAASALEAALDELEHAAPPILHIQLMGEFSLRRGERVVGPDDWPRPAVRRLLQYFALHRGEPLSRDCILEDLWAESDPQSARASFKQVFSWLRKVIEPHMRPRAASRYITVKDDVYCFDPRRAVAHIDLIDFEAAVRPVLAQAERHDVLPLPEPFARALLEWKPLLSDIPYEAWTLERREKSLNLYVEGCLYAARALLAIDQSVEAGQWAGRAIASAPWLEEAYQALMRAQARQGNRTLALKTYVQSVDALERELNIPPSALTEWLAQRLRAGQDI